MKQEHSFYLNNNAYRLYCTQYMPMGPVKCAVVLCHPFAEEKLWAQRVYVSFARLLAQNGYWVLRVDYMGHGDSDGDFSDATVKTRLSDINCALDFLKSQVDSDTPLCLAGLRFGATLASILSEMRNDLSYLVLWEPIVNGESYMRQLLRINIATQTAVYKQVVNNSEALVAALKRNETINIDGYEIGWRFYEQLVEIDLLNRRNRFNGQVLLVSLAGNIEKENRQLLNLNQHYTRSSYATVVAKPFWNNVQAYCDKSDHLFAQTLQWLEGKTHDTR